MRTPGSGAHVPEMRLAAELPVLPLEGAPEASFAEIFRAHAPYVVRLARRLGFSAADAEDLCQEVFVTLHRRLGDYRGEGSLRSFVYGIAVRLAMNDRRRAHRRREIATEHVPEQTSPSDPGAIAERRSALAALDRALAALPDAQRVVFVLFEIEELEMAEVAEVAGCPPKTAYSRLYAARAHVEAALRAEEGGEP